MASQLPLPLPATSALGRADFIVAPGNAQAVAFIDSYPAWPAPAAALYGPPGSGKSHLLHVWSEAAGAVRIAAANLDMAFVATLEPGRAVAIDDVETRTDDAPLFALFQRMGPVLLTGHEPPKAWPATFPDLVSRFASLLAFPLWAPDDALLAALTRKLFTDRQLAVPDTVVMRIVNAIERSPAAIRDFVARADARALAKKSPVSAALVAELLAETEAS
ncbi:MAG: chromosomal replication initiator DnaA [Proteobacteria bacterium]|nr:chromosomal replication initiator DnaA [Pseudomonadota bacterium]